MNHSQFMRQALSEAKQAARVDEVPVGAVLVAQDGTVLAKEHNRTITLCDPTAHAEILALREASRTLGNYRLLNTTLYVTIEPCIMCMGALLQARVAKIVFGAKDPKCGGAGSCYNLAADAALNHMIDVQAGLLENECRTLIQEFFRAKRPADKR
ncbi:MAG: tRNA adenosine(34) deaminase TadA [Deltaproteobacteria bacterium]|nr:tRNA adenosine(34) deaminase TadA [Deltaproteobacteria bacterium]